MEIIEVTSLHITISPSGFFSYSVEGIKIVVLATKGKRKAFGLFMAHGFCFFFFLYFR